MVKISAQARPGHEVLSIALDIFSALLINIVIDPSPPHTTTADLQSLWRNLYWYGESTGIVFTVWRIAG
jgi:hypothetical protein